MVLEKWSKVQKIHLVLQRGLRYCLVYKPKINTSTEYFCSVIGLFIDNLKEDYENEVMMLFVEETEDILWGHDYTISHKTALTWLIEKLKAFIKDALFQIFFHINIARATSTTPFIISISSDD